MSEKIENVFEIPSYNMPYIRKEIDTLNKRAAKKGIDNFIIVDEFERFTKNIKKSAVDIGAVEKSLIREGLVEWPTYKIEMVKVKVEGEAPKYKGWTLVAAIDHFKADENLIKTVPGETVDDKYRNADSVCDHCHVDRFRKKTYVCRHEDGTEKKVGSTCIKDFLGHKSPEAIAWLCESFCKVTDMFSFENYGGLCGIPRSEYRISMRKFVKMAACVVHENGWVPKSKAELWEKNSTAVLVELALFPSRKDVPPVPNSDDARLGYAALEWARGLRPRPGNEYEYNLHVLAKSDSLPISEIGLMTSMVGVFKNMKDKKNENKSKFKNEWFGEIKKRYELDLKVLSEKTFEDDWGMKTLYKMVDPEGRRFAWFCTNMLDLEINETYHVKTTVKKHNEWNGMKETIVNRLKVMMAT